MKLLKKILKEEVNNFLLNETWNFHFSGEKEIDPKEKYKSDTKYMIGGRDTGHFGSGTYFSTYQGSFERRDVSDFINQRENDKQLIKIKDGVYRVDLDLYKNLYRVENKIEGDILYTALKNVNIFYECVNEKYYDNLSILYQKIAINCKSLGLNLPNYKSFINMAKSHGNSSDAQSFSTYFMEYNGFNGVNVSGIDYYDNSTHGSVIYDLSNVGIEKINLTKNIKGATDSVYSDTLATNGFLDDVKNPQISSLIGEFNGININELLKLDDSLQLRYLKNYTLNGKILDEYYMRRLNDNVIKKYMNFILVKKPRTEYSDFDRLVDYYKLCDTAYKYKIYSWINYKPNDYNYSSGLETFLSNYNSYKSLEEKKEYLNFLLKYLKRDLTDDEKDYIENIYLDEDE